MTDLIFLYGTLRRGSSRHNILKRLGAEYVGKGTVQGELFDLGDYPGARKTEKPSSRVVGEIYRLPNPAQAFAVLDAVEGFRPSAPESSLFRRETTTARLANGECRTAWLYWLSRGRGPMRRIRSGDYTGS